jgi:Mg2+ and Co2+ transporter CorA
MLKITVEIKRYCYADLLFLSAHYRTICVLSHEHQTDHPLIFQWVDCIREDVVNHAEEWQKKIKAITDLSINEFHIRDILNIDHPCDFDTMEDYDVLIFRKIITPEDHIENNNSVGEQHESIFGLATTPISFIVSQHILVSVREQGNQAVDNYVQRFQSILQRSIQEQNKPRKLPQSPIDLSLRLLNTIIDGYLALRTPLTRRVEHWQRELLQGESVLINGHSFFRKIWHFSKLKTCVKNRLKRCRNYVMNWWKIITI